MPGLYTGSLGLFQPGGRPLQFLPPLFQTGLFCAGFFRCFTGCRVCRCLLRCLLPHLCQDLLCFGQPVVLGQLGLQQSQAGSKRFRLLCLCGALFQSIRCRRLLGGQFRLLPGQLLQLLFQFQTALRSCQHCPVSLHFLLYFCRLAGVLRSGSRV